MIPRLKGLNKFTTPCIYSPTTNANNFPYFAWQKFNICLKIFLTEINYVYVTSRYFIHKLPTQSSEGTQTTVKRFKPQFCEKKFDRLKMQVTSQHLFAYFKENLRFIIAPIHSL